MHAIHEGSRILWAKGTSVWLYFTASSCHDMLCGPKCKTQKQTLTLKSQLIYWEKKTKTGMECRKNILNTGTKD